MRSSLSKLQLPSKFNQEEIKELREQCYGMGIVIIELAAIDNDFVKQGIVNIMNKLYPTTRPNAI